MSKKRITTMEEIAELAQVSKPTVSRALSGSPLVNAKTREHVIAVAQKYGYTVNRNAQKLRHSRANTVAVSIDFHSHRANHISDPFIFELLSGISEALGERNIDLLLTAPKHNNPDTWLQMLTSKAVDGFIFLGQGHREEALCQFARQNAPMIVWGAKRHKEPYCVVGSDNHLGGKLVGDYLLQKGRTHVLFVGNTDHNEIYWRREGLSHALQQQPGCTIQTMKINNFSYESVYDSASEYFSSGHEAPNAVFAFSDTAAMAIIHVLLKLGYKVPEDVSVVGYNDIPTSAFFSPAITTVRQDTHLAGEVMVKKLLRLIDGKRTKTETIATELIIRDT